MSKNWALVVVAQEQATGVVLVPKWCAAKCAGSCTNTVTEETSSEDKTMLSVTNQVNTISDETNCWYLCQSVMVVADWLGLVILMSVGVELAACLSHCVDRSQLASCGENAILLTDQALGSINVNLVLRLDDSAGGVVLRWQAIKNCK